MQLIINVGLKKGVAIFYTTTSVQVGVSSVV